MYCCTPKVLYNHVGWWGGCGVGGGGGGGGVSQPPPLCSIHLDIDGTAMEYGTSCVNTHQHRWRGSYRWRGERVIEDNQVYALTTHQLQVERRESHRANQVYALTTHQLQVERRESHRDNQVYALTTHQLQVERRERVIETIRCMRSPPHQLQVERREGP